MATQYTDKNRHFSQFLNFGSKIFKISKFKKLPSHRIEEAFLYLEHFSNQNSVHKSRIFLGVYKVSFLTTLTNFDLSQVTTGSSQSNSDKAIRLSASNYIGMPILDLFEGVGPFLLIRRILTHIFFYSSLIMHGNETAQI